MDGRHRHRASIGRLASAMAVLATTLALPAEAPEPQQIRALIEDHELAEAARAARALLEDIRARSADGTVEEADALDLLVETLLRSGRQGEPETPDLADRALRVRERWAGERHADLEMALMNLGYIHYQAHRYDEARAIYERLIPIVETARGTDDPKLEYYARMLGGVHLQQDRYAEARVQFERALSIMELIEGPDSPALAKPLIDLSICAQNEGRYDAAEAHLARLDGILERASHPDPPLRAHVINARATLDYKLGRFLEATIDLPAPSPSVNQPAEVQVKIRNVGGAASPQGTRVVVTVSRSTLGVLTLEWLVPKKFYASHLLLLDWLGPIDVRRSPFQPAGAPLMITLPWLVRIDRELDSIEPQDHRLIQVPFTPVKAGTHEVRVTADVTGHIRGGDGPQVTEVSFAVS